MSDWLKQLSTKAEKRPDILVVHGVEGSGKTSFAAQFPGAAFMMSENESGLLTLSSKGLVPEAAHFPVFRQWSEVIEATDQMIASKDRPRTLVVDTTNGIESLLHSHVARDKYGGDWSKKGFLNFQEGFKVSVPIWREWLAKLDALRSKGTTVVLLCHTRIENFKNPEGADFHRYVAELHPETLAATKKFADVVLFLNFHVEVAEVNDQSGRGKGKGGRTRLYHCERSAAWDAKNRHGLPAQFIGKGSAEKDFAEFVRLVKAGVVGGK
tara:strand:+ start:2516 stop:3319 length:804 start_codon:yes stop_codon:yes gene_type:complete